MAFPGGGPARTASRKDRRPAPIAVTVSARQGGCPLFCGWTRGSPGLALSRPRSHLSSVTAARPRLRAVAPHTELAGHASIYQVTRRVFKTAGVDRTRAGTRLLRHNAASKLLRAGTPLPTISAVLGHSSPDATNVYLSTDTEHMLACVLPLPLVLHNGVKR
ncbi:tyrosine-type recombinase/integrase [Paenarthrobacter sp. PH39-S1]|uniref:tyrosine-type recombinase/integrase n=1 Tax=Paenarthrobacter sp. PH39-S1 TaxID=3046204 RepID=UPI0024BBE055|nr:tyrosine-type recombinase/integrase [Paenarthrobacter sp. PH39-S1]MDJ0357948.1 tyrosine-type recombinase/integrase [Paenarthrobacter sp. PH39-S1]